MLMIFSDQNAVRTEAVLLAASESRLRVAVSGNDDVVEFRRVYGRWISETGQEIEIEAIAPNSAQEQVIRLFEPSAHHALGAGAGEYWIG